MEKRVAIIGSGISGLLACKYTLSKGFNPLVFEAQDNIGGVWYKTTENTRLQNVKEFYQFLDFPWPSHVRDTFPTSAQVREYLKSYAENFQLLPYIKFNSEVVSIDYAGESVEERALWDLWAGNNGRAFGSSRGKWILRVRDTKQDSVREYEAEFVILCIGRFSGLPDIPEFRLGHGPEVFAGKVLHSMDYYTMENANASLLIKGKRIAIVGSGKSAVDIAFECANANGIDKPCTVVQRTVHWMFPDAQPWGVIFGTLCFTRFSELMVHKPGEGLFSSVLATSLSPLRWGISKFVESYLRWKLPLKKFDMIPEESFVREVSSCQILFVLDDFYDRVEDGSVVFKKSKNIEFCKEGLVLDGGNEIVKADIVIFATGYKGDLKLRQIFADPTFQRIVAGTETSSIPLYRQMIHPRIPQLAVMGYSESLSNLHTFEMRAQWLGFFLDQAFELPSIREMERDVEEWEIHMKRYAGNGKFRRACIAGISIWYNDQLCKDIGCNPRRKNGFFKDLFEPYGSEDYKGLAPPAGM